MSNLIHDVLLTVGLIGFYLSLIYLTVWTSKD